jgi:CRP-like cAMP-binding protein
MGNEKHRCLIVLKSKLDRIVHFSEGAWSAAEEMFCYRRFPAGVHVIEAGEIIGDLHFLSSGIARYYYLTPDGKEFNKSFARDGQVLSSVSSLVNGTPSPFFIQALEPCECLSIAYMDLTALCDDYREWDTLVRRLLEQLVIKKERREADFLLLSAAEQYKKFLIEFADVADRIPHYHVASYLGITDVALSRIRKRLGLVRVEVKAVEARWL